MSRAKMLRSTGNETSRRGRLPLRGDLSPFDAGLLDRCPSFGRIGVGSTMSIASALAGLGPGRPCREEDPVSPLPRVRMWRSIARLAGAEDASDASPTSPNVA